MPDVEIVTESKSDFVAPSVPDGRFFKRVATAIEAEAEAACSKGFFSFARFVLCCHFGPAPGLCVFVVVIFLWSYSFCGCF